MRLADMGYGSLISVERVISVLSPESAPIKRLIQEERERGRLIDASYGRKTRSVLMTDSGHIFLSALTVEQIRDKMEANEEGGSMSTV